MGQGNFTAFAVVAAEALGLPPDRVRLHHLDTRDGPDDRGVYGSRGAYVTATAVARAARALGDELVAAAEAAWGLPPGSASLGDGGVVVAAGRELAFSQLGTHRSEGVFAAPDNALVAGAQFVEVTVDTATGIVVVDRVTSVHDVGKVLHAGLARGQVEGGVVQSIGYALSERLRLDDDGAPIERGFLDHLVPTTACAPEVDAVFVTARPHPHSATGAKGIGEAPVLAVAPAIANAIRHATGARLTQLPMTPERVLAALDALDLPPGSDETTDRTDLEVPT
jgi:CO/xanthine dehydrogenase Mo-binding subunit